MQTIGVIGGISWVSSLEYYRRLNELVAGRLGGLNSAAVLMYSIPFGAFSEQERLAEEGDWAPLRATMLDAAARLRRGGADFIIIASNTMNSTADLIEEQIGIPVLHIADATGAAIKQRGIKKVALLGTRYTMEADFYRRHLRDNYSLEVVVPNADERRLINDVIFDELCANIFRDESRQAYIEIIERLARDEGTEGVILGCTEIPLLIQQKHVSIPVFDTTAIHTEAAVERALQGR
ncbi:MAG: aspartate/glutamate racemase family protein [Chromatiaceae bacterium]|nr:aspartate/glutamate racemase family protein [Chromatiaceae bacterium]